jgi:hypothetical protein
MRFTVGLSLLVAAGAVPAAVAEEAHTTRIETRPYYGAVVTIENGVRVYRPVPPTTHLIINPDGLTPLGISINDGAVVRSGSPETSDR